MKQRLHKIIAKSTKHSLRKAEELIQKGKVIVNGRVVTKLGSFADPREDKIEVEGKRIRPVKEAVYVIYYKPKGVIVSKSDPEGRKTIWDDLKQFRDRLNSVGRLDYDSEGLLILTNDGGLINKLTHPRHKIEKTYKVKVKGRPEDLHLDRIRNGITYQNINYQPAKVKFISRSQKNTWFEVKISEGKNRQVRYMFEAINFPVLKLVRTSIDRLKIGTLKPSEWRYLNIREIAPFL